VEISNIEGFGGLVAETIADFFAGKNNADGLDDICPRNNLLPDSSGCDGASARKIPERLILLRSGSLAPLFPSLKTLVAHFFSLEQKQDASHFRNIISTEGVSHG
jgi:hypothetical protein